MRDGSLEGRPPSVNVLRHKSHIMHVAVRMLDNFSQISRIINYPLVVIYYMQFPKPSSSNFDEACCLPIAEILSD